MAFRFAIRVRPSVYTRVLSSVMVYTFLKMDSRREMIDWIVYSIKPFSKEGSSYHPYEIFARFFCFPTPIERVFFQSKLLLSSESSIEAKKCIIATSFSSENWICSNLFWSRVIPIESPRHCFILFVKISIIVAVAIEISVFPFASERFSNNKQKSWKELPKAKIFSAILLASNVLSDTEGTIPDWIKDEDQKFQLIPYYKAKK